MYKSHLGDSRTRIDISSLEKECFWPAVLSFHRVASLTRNAIQDAKGVRV